MTSYPVCGQVYPTPSAICGSASRRAWTAVEGSSCWRAVTTLRPSGLNWSSWKMLWRDTSPGHRPASCSSKWRLGDSKLTPSRGTWRFRGSVWNQSDRRPRCFWLVSFCPVMESPPDPSAASSFLSVTSWSRCCWVGRSLTCARTSWLPARHPTWSFLAMGTCGWPAAPTTPTQTVCLPTWPIR